MGKNHLRNKENGKGKRVKNWNPGQLNVSVCKLREIKSGKGAEEESLLNHMCPTVKGKWTSSQSPRAMLPNARVSPLSHSVSCQQTCLPYTQQRTWDFPSQGFMEPGINRERHSVTWRGRQEGGREPGLCRLQGSVWFSYMKYFPKGKKTSEVNYSACLQTFIQVLKENLFLTKTHRD